MTSTTFFIIFIPILAILLLAINLILAPHNPYQEKDSVFECGFHSFLGQNRTQFSVSFFIFALLFLLFDLEILLVYPYSVSGYTNDIYGLVIMMVFFVLLTLGFIFELGKNALTIDSRQTSSYGKVDSSETHAFLTSSIPCVDMFLGIEIFTDVVQSFLPTLSRLSSKRKAEDEDDLGGPSKRLRDEDNSPSSPESTSPQNVDPTSNADSASQNADPAPQDLDPGTPEDRSVRDSAVDSDSTSADITREEITRRVEAIDRRLPHFEQEFERLSVLYHVAETVETQGEPARAALTDEEIAAWNNSGRPDAETLSNDLEAVRRTIGKLCHERDSWLESDTESSNGDSSSDSESVGSEGSAANNNTNSGSLAQNNTSSQPNNPTSSPSGEPLPNSVADNQDENFFLPIAFTPVLRILSLLYSWHKIGILLPLLYYWKCQLIDLYSYIFNRKK